MYEETIKEVPQMLLEVADFIDKNNFDAAEEKTRYVMAIFTKEFKIDLVLKGNDILKLLKDRQYDQAKHEAKGMSVNMTRNFALQNK